jgi:hypothetical protein
MLIRLKTGYIYIRQQHQLIYVVLYETGITYKMSGQNGLFD